MTAVRELYEETGYDAEHLIDASTASINILRRPMKSLKHNLTLFVVPDFPEDSPFDDVEDPHVSQMSFFCF